MTTDFVLLSKTFYNEYPSELYPEMQQKPNRPYLVVLISVRDTLFAIPMRHHIMHRYSFITNRAEHWGLDYTKSIVITNTNFIANVGHQILINESEYRKIRDNHGRIMRDFQKYLDYYERAVLSDTPTRDPVIKYSALQYFHNELGLTHKLLLLRRNPT